MKLLIAIALFMAAAAMQTTVHAQRSEGNDAQREAELVRTAAEQEAQAVQAAAVQNAAAAREAVVQREAELLEVDSAELGAAREKLRAARAELERAAQELARVSAEQYGAVADTFAVDRSFVRIRRPLLGLNVTSDDDGVRVIGVSPSGPGDAAGVEIGDLIVAVDGLDVSGSAAANSSRIFLDHLAQVEVGGDVELAIVRDGEPIELTVETSERNIPIWIGDLTEPTNGGYRELQSRYRNLHIAPVAGDRNFTVLSRPAFVAGRWNDMQLVELTPELGEYFGTEQGLLIVRAPGGDEIDLRDGDVILEIGGRTPQSVGHAMRILSSFEPEETLEVTIMREQRRRTVELSR